MKRIRRIIMTGILPAAVCITAAYGNTYGAPLKNALNIHPLDIVSGSIGGTYEHLVGDRHGIMLHGSFSAGHLTDAGSDRTAAVHYRHHYFPGKKHQGLHSPFWGPFVCYENVSTEIKDQDDVPFDVCIEYVKAGISWGKRWLWKNRFNAVFRIGYGVPIYVDYEWLPEKPDDADIIENITTAVIGLDGELSVGISF